MSETPSDKQVMDAFLQAVARGERVALATVVCSSDTVPLGAKLLAREGAVTGSFGSEALDAWAREQCQKALAERESRMVRHAEGLEVFFEVVEPTRTLLVVGAGHIGQALSRLGKFLGFQVAVIDDRPFFANAEHLPEADEIITEDFAQALGRFPIHEATYVVLVTRGHEHDEVSLRQVISSKAAYVGMIGSKRRVRAVLERLRAEGVPEALIKRVHSPIGMDIGAETPEEIAVSIAAELIMAQRGGTGASLSQKEG